ncbi:ATP-grasp domain-containing protein [Luteolibacter marinus]|uniref:ATP-grasp domain-containing protein n=1 Tax=Luteolibacter marinus TaxID=2776705 RepID=UPI0018688006
MIGRSSPLGRGRFREERGRLFNRGVVLREFLPIVERGSDIRGLPLVEETRLFFWQDEPLVIPEPSTPGPMDEIGRWKEIARRFRSDFLTIDVALLEDGSWKIVETGDGQVSGLPVGLDPERFYASLWNKSIADD